MAYQPIERLSDFDRDHALTQIQAMIRKTWQEFDRARPTQPEISAATRELLTKPLPEAGIEVMQALRDAETILDQSISQPRPRFFAFVGSSGLEMGVLADALMSCHDINMAVYAGAASSVEEQAIAWISEFVNYPYPYGIFTSGGMVSNLTALTAARQFALPKSRQTGIRQDVAVYTSRDAHSSIERAIEILGFGTDCIRDIPINEKRQLDAKALEELVEQDIAKGVLPVAIVASAGTTLSGAVDPIDAIAAIAQKYRIWVHVDGAYGFPAASVEPHHFEGLAHADSITIDAHKWMYLPKPCGVLLVKDKSALRNTFAHDATYIPEEESYVHPVEMTLEYSRPFRALKVWLAFQTYGAGAFRSAIQRNLNQARICAEKIIASDKLDLIMQPQLSVVLFRYKAQNTDINALNQQLVRDIQADGRVYIAGANVDGVDCIRACFVNYRTQADDIQVLIDTVEELGTVLDHQPSVSF